VGGVFNFLGRPDVTPYQVTEVCGRRISIPN